MTATPEHGAVQPTEVEYTDNTIFRFERDAATLVDPSAVASVLSDAADWLKQDPAHRVVITGRTSSGPTRWPSHEELGAARAHTVETILVDTLHVPASQISTYGAGYTANSPDGGPDHLDPGKAALNRAVVLTYSTR